MSTYRRQIGGASQLCVLGEDVMCGGAHHDEHVDHTALRDPVSVCLWHLVTAASHDISYL